MTITPELHAILLGAAVVSGLIFSGIILARNPRSTPARLHAIYGGVVSWWFFCMAMAASADTPDPVQLWARLLYLGIGSLPGVAYHLNAATAGLAHEHRRRIKVYYGLSAAVVLFGLTWPDLLAEPTRFRWGLYPSFTLWGLAPVLLLLAMFVDVLRLYRALIQRSQPGSHLHERARAFHYGNCIAIFALVDFLPTFGFPVYPFGFVIMTLMHAATVLGAVRYQLIEVTPELAAERILETIPDGLLVLDTQGLVGVANPAAARMFGRKLTHLVQRPLDSVIADPGLREAFRSPAASALVPHEVSFAVESGEHRIVGISGSTITDQSDRPLAHVWVLHDVTDQRAAEAEHQRLEEWIRQTQRLETVGVMAGGVAHDFNNILMAIMGSAELARADLPAQGPVYDELGRIMLAVERAADLTNQLLTFSGRGTPLRTPVDLNASVREIADLMHAAISKKASLELDLPEQLPCVIGDASQIQQVILNLVTNASEALGDAAGTITLRTGPVEPGSTLQSMLAAGGECRAAKHVFLEVSDTGKGMDPITMAKAFDPFFTTKLTGRGLGLATVMGIVQGHGGLVHVESEPGAGARFTVVLPADTEASTSPRLTEGKGVAWHGCGVALLADDEVAVRRIARRMLIDRGFQVLEAADGAEAVAIFRARSDEIALVVLDVTMPVLTGREAFAEIRALAGEVPVVFISGYADPEGADAILDPRTVQIQKPFRLEAFLSAIRKVMGIREKPPS